MFPKGFVVMLMENVELVKLLSLSVWFDYQCSGLSAVCDCGISSQCPTVTLEERSKRQNFSRITPNFGLFQWIRRHFWCFD